jgi:hypothetical protein
MFVSPVDPYNKDGTLDVQPPAEGFASYPLRFRVVTVATEPSQLSWLQAGSESEKFLFQVDAAPNDSLVCSAPVGLNVGVCDVARVPIQRTGVTFWAPNPRRIIDPAATGPLQAALDIPDFILSQLTVPTLTVTIQGPQEGQSVVSTGDVVTITAHFDYGTLADTQGFQISLTSDGDASVAAGSDCPLGQTIPTSTGGFVTLTCTLVSNGTLAITASMAPLLPGVGAPAILDQPLTAAANISGKNCVSRRTHACFVCLKQVPQDVWCEAFPAACGAAHTLGHSTKNSGGSLARFPSFYAYMHMLCAATPASPPFICSHTLCWYCHDVRWCHRCIEQ